MQSARNLVDGWQAHGSLKRRRGSTVPAPVLLCSSRTREGTAEATEPVTTTETTGPVTTANVPVCLVGAGCMGVILATDTEPRVAVKLGVRQVGASASEKEDLVLTSSSRAEGHAHVAAAFVLGAFGMDDHLARPLGTVDFALRAGLRFGGRAATALQGGVLTGHVMELLRLPFGTSSWTLKAFIAAGADQETRLRVLGCQTDVEFVAELKAVLFQAMSVVAAWTIGTRTGFRHNDLHALNVCVEAAPLEAADTRVQYHIPTPGPDSVDRTFHVSRRFRVRIVDFGFAAVLPHVGGTPYDERFYAYMEDLAGGKRPVVRSDPTAPSGLREFLFHKLGMSHMVPSEHYDMGVLLFSAKAEVDAAFGETSPVATELTALVCRTFGDVVTNPKWMQQRHQYGRLTALAQVLVWGGGSTGGSQRGETLPSMSCPVQVLCDPYFAPFRCSGVPVPDGPPVRYAGVTPHVRERIAPLRVAAQDMVGTTSVLAANPNLRQFVPKVCRRTRRLLTPPPVGLWATVLDACQRIVEVVPPGRPMTPDEAASWVAGAKIPS